MQTSTFTNNSVYFDRMYSTVHYIKESVGSFCPIILSYIYQKLSPSQHVKTFKYYVLTVSYSVQYHPVTTCKYYTLKIAHQAPL